MTRSERQALKDFVYQDAQYTSFPKGFPSESELRSHKHQCCIAFGSTAVALSYPVEEKLFVFLACFPNMPEEIREVLLVETAAYLLEHHG